MWIICPPLRQTSVPEPLISRTRSNWRPHSSNQVSIQYVTFSSRICPISDWSGDTEWRTQELPWSCKSTQILTLSGERSKASYRDTWKSLTRQEIFKRGLTTSWLPLQVVSGAHTLEALRMLKNQYPEMKKFSYIAARVLVCKKVANTLNIKH